MRWVRSPLLISFFSIVRYHDLILPIVYIETFSIPSLSFIPHGKQLQRYIQSTYRYISTVVPSSIPRQQSSELRARTSPVSILLSPFHSGSWSTARLLWGCIVMRLWMDDSFVIALETSKIIIIESTSTQYCSLPNFGKM